MSTRVLTYWFETLSPAQWWQKSDVIDADIRKNFLTLHEQAIRGELATWRSTPEGALAEVIVLDQFSRNIYRDTPDAFASDPLALALAQTAIERNQHTALTQGQRYFLYMPYMHSESALIHEQAVKLFEALDDTSGLEFELKHKAIIDRFGRYPHRNAILGRTSTPEETIFLQEPGSSF